MADSKLSSEVLNYLWTSCREDSTLFYDISPLCRKRMSDPVMVSNGLRLEGLIKDEVYSQDQEVRCSIAMKGIMLVDREYVEKAIDRVLAGMGGVNSIGNVMEILKLSAKEFQLAFDLANEMQNRDLVKLLYAFQPGNKVNVEMTLEGVRRKSTPSTGDRS